MTPVVRPVLEGLFPASLDRLARRTGTVSVVLALCAWFLFPASAHAGTETQEARAVTAVALGAAGFLLRMSRGRLAFAAAAIAVLVAASFAAPAPWLLLHGGLVCFYCATALVPRGEWKPAREDEDPPPAATQEMVESVAMALVLALVVREFGFEAFKIPTGSMVPTILGDEGKRKGDRLLAFKPVEYRRWDIVVFRWPLFRGTNYIKRLVGLPGEHVEIRDGDIYVDGVIAPKPDDVQAVMWRPRLSLGGEQPWDDVFDPDQFGAWSFARGEARVDAVTGREDAPGVAWAQIRGGFREDQRVSFDVEVEGDPGAGDGELRVGLEGGKRVCELDVGADDATVTAPGGPWKVPMDGLSSLGRRFRLGFSVSDRICRVYVGGRQVASWQHADSTNGGLEPGKVRIGARRLRARIRNLVVENDVQYAKKGGWLSSWDVPEDGYVMLGDNTESSRDSREWTANVVVTKDGREFVAPYQARLAEDRGEETVFHRKPDGGVDFLDADGVRRQFTGAEVAEVRNQVHQPFPRRADLVGRAFLIFYPFPPFGDFRPRLLR